MSDRIGIHPRFPHGIVCFCTHCRQKGIDAGIEEKDIKRETLHFSSDENPPPNAHFHYRIYRGNMTTWGYICSSCVADKSICGECVNDFGYNVRTGSTETIQSEYKRIRLAKEALQEQIDTLAKKQSELAVQLAEIQ